MSGTADADVKITLSANDQASGTVQSATQQINSSFRSMTQSQNAAGRSFLVSNQGLYAYGRAAQSVGRITDKAISLFNSYNLMQIRVTQATQANTDAQETLAETIAQYGANSPQAQTAAEAAAKTQADMAKAAEDAQVQFALMVASSVAQSGTLVTTVIPRLLALSSAIKGVSIASGVNAAVNVAAGGGVGAGALGGAAGGGVGAGALGGAAGLAVKLGTSALKIAPAAGGAAAAVQLLSMMGSQQAGGGEATGVATGTDALAEIANDISQAITNPNSQQRQNINNTISIIGYDIQSAVNELEKKLGIANSANGQSP